MRATALCFLLYAVLAVALVNPVWRSPLTQYVGGGADPQQTFWFLAWTPFAIGHGHDPLLSTYLNYPAGINLMWNTWAPAVGVLLWPVTAAWGPVATYNVAMTAAIVLAAFSAFLAIRRFVPSTTPAAVGGLLYGFSPFVMAQALGHKDLVVSAITPPLALMLLDELLLRQRLRAWLLGVLIAALGVLQFFIAEEIFVTEILAGAVVVLILAVSFRDRVRTRAAYAARALAPAIAITALLLAVPVAVQLFGPQRVAQTPLHSPDIFLTDPFNLVLPTSVQLIAPHAVQQLSMHFTGNSSESDGYLGLPLLATLLVALWRCWRVPLVRVSGLTAIVITILSLGPHLHVLGKRTPLPLPWWIPAHLPVIDNLQPNRLMVYVFLAAGVALAFVLRRLRASRHGRLRIAALALVALAPLVPTLPLPSSPVTVPAYFTGPLVNRIPDGAVAITAPWSGNDEAGAMVWQAASEMRFRMVGGYYIGPVSASAQDVRAALVTIAAGHPAPMLDSAHRALMLDELHRDHVSVAIAGPSPRQPEFVAFLTDLLGAAPESDAGVDVWLLSGAATPSR